LHWWFALSLEKRPLDYAPVPRISTGDPGFAAIWCTFFIASIFGAPFARWVVESWYFVQHSDGYVLIIAVLSIVPLAVLLGVIRRIVPRSRSSLLVPLVLGFFGPLAVFVLLGVTLFG
jgi:hypothetical protein